MKKQNDEWALIMATAELSREIRIKAEELGLKIVEDESIPSKKPTIGVLITLRMK